MASPDTPELKLFLNQSQPGQQVSPLLAIATGITLMLRHQFNKDACGVRHCTRVTCTDRATLIQIRLIVIRVIIIISGLLPWSVSFWLYSDSGEGAQVVPLCECRTRRKGEISFANFQAPIQWGDIRWSNCHCLGKQGCASANQTWPGDV